MGMLFGGWAEEEEEDIANSGLTREQYYVAKRWNEKNHVYLPGPKKAIYRGIELVVGDRITPDYYTGNQYLIRDFKENGTPIVDEISFEKDRKCNKEYDHLELFVIKSSICC